MRLDKFQGEICLEVAQGFAKRRLDHQILESQPQIAGDCITAGSAEGGSTARGTARPVKQETLLF